MSEQNYLLDTIKSMGHETDFVDWNRSQTIGLFLQCRRELLKISGRERQLLTLLKLLADAGIEVRDGKLSLGKYKPIVICANCERQFPFHAATCQDKGEYTFRPILPTDSTEKEPA